MLKPTNLTTMNRKLINTLFFATLALSSCSKKGSDNKPVILPVVVEDAKGDGFKNPFVTDIYTADPSAHVWADGRLYVYPSHDIAPPRGCDLMDQYHVYSTADMISWRDEGEIFRATDAEWGRPDGGFMWAPDAAYKNGTYYFYYPHPSGTEWNTTWKIGVATSKSPAKDFKSQGYILGWNR
jgi:arabinoxylan arabinofuranohydrolase